MQRKKQSKSSSIQLAAAMAPRETTDEEQPLVATTSNYQSAADASSDVLVPAEDPPAKRRISKGHILLFVVAILYGSLNVSLRGVYAQPNPPSPSALSTLRGWLAALCFVPLLLNQKQQTNPNPSSTSTHQLWKVAAELALWNFGAQGLVNVGLTYIASARAAFFTQLSVVMTPCLAALAGHKVKPNVWWACAFALAGLICMSKKDDDDEDTQNAEAGFTLGFGDALVLCGALSWSTYLFRLSAVGDQYDEIHLQAIKTFLMAILYSTWCGVEFVISGGASPWLGWTSLAAWALLFYSALGPGTIADVLQQKGQSTVTATVANVILSLEPVFTALFGRILLGEMTSGMEKVGGCLILAAALVATMRE